MLSRSNSSPYPQAAALRRTEAGHLFESLGFPRSRDPAALTLSVPRVGHENMQTVSLPYRRSAEDRAFLDDCRRISSAAVRTPYANAVDPDGEALKQKPLRDLVKSRFAGGVLEACATLEGINLCKRVPDGRMVFDGRASLERRCKDLNSVEEWRQARLRPITTRGDKQYAGNRHFRLSADGRTPSVDISPHVSKHVRAATRGAGLACSNVKHVHLRCLD